VVVHALDIVIGVKRDRGCFVEVSPSNWLWDIFFISSSVLIVGEVGDIRRWFCLLNPFLSVHILSVKRYFRLIVVVAPNCLGGFILEESLSRRHLVVIALMRRRFGDGSELVSGFLVVVEGNGGLFVVLSPLHGSGLVGFV
jgi:hypothetical protein